MKDLNYFLLDCFRIVLSYKNVNLLIFLSEVIVGVFLSYIEGFFIFILEKLVFGLFVIVYDILGIREVLCCFDNLLLVFVGDVE